jgi:hypothetical protein
MADQHRTPTSSDDRGDYRLFWLPPGQYYIGAFPEGLRRRAAAVPFGPPGAVESLNQIYPEAPIQYRASGGDVFEEVYETVYAPGASSICVWAQTSTAWISRSPRAAVAQCGFAAW